MKKKNTWNIPKSLFAVHVIEVGCGLYALYCNYYLYSYIFFVLSAFNLFVAQFLLAIYHRKKQKLALDSASGDFGQSEELNTQIQELTDSLASLRDENENLRSDLLSYEVKLNAAPVLYHCPLTTATPLNLQKFLQTYFDQHVPDFHRLGIQGTLQIEPGSYLTLLSSAALTIICDNLLDNSLKFTPSEGTIVITLAQSGHDLLLIWKNSGSGISEADTKKVFDLNYHNSSTGTGTGLGLVQVKAIVDDFGADIYAKSSIGNGFSIYLTLPSCE